MRKVLALTLIVALGLSAIGYAQELGTRNNPISWIFVPSQEKTYLEEIAGQIVEDISEITGLYFEYTVMADYTAFIEEFIAADGNVMGAPTTAQYAEISVATNFQATPRLGSVRYGMPYYYSAVYAMRDRGFTSIQDLAGLEWAYPHEGSTSGYLIPKMMFDAAGVAFGEPLPSGDHQGGLLAVLDGDADFCTGFWNPATPPQYIWDAMVAQGMSSYWYPGWDAEMWLWDYFNNALYPEDIRGNVQDLRESVGDMDTHTYGDGMDLVESVQVLALAGPIPNDCFAFCANFPVDLQDKIVDAIVAHIASDEGLALWGDTRFYKWTAVERIDDSYYNNYRTYVGMPNPGE